MARTPNDYTHAHDRNTRTVSLADDDRARVPFAMIAVLLLVASIGIVATLEQRSDPVIDQEAALVVDRTETAAQAELRSATIDASHAAVSVPIINASGPDVDDIDAIGPSRDDNFENYLKLLIYLEAHDRLPAAGQTAGTDATSTVSIPPVTDDGSGGLTPDEAIDAVDLTIGDDPTTALEPGLLEVRLENVTVDATVDERALPTDGRNISVTVGSPVMQLDERTTAYETRLNQSFFDEGIDTELEGLGQHMAARLYPVAYFKAGWDRTKQTRGPDYHDFDRVLEPGHTEVLANHAIFAIQEDEFGTQDPYAERTLRPGYICMAYQLGESMSGQRGDDDTDEFVDEDDFGMADDVEKVQSSNGSNGTGNIDIEEQLCDGGEVQKWLFGNQTNGELPDMPELSELIQGGLGEMEVMNESETIPVGEAAEVSYLYYESASYVDQGELFVDRTNDAIDDVEPAFRDDVEETIDEDDDPPDIEDDHRSIRSMVDELYAVDIERDVSTHSVGRMPSPSVPDPSSNYTSEEYDAAITAVREVEANHDAYPDSASQTIHEMDTSALVEVDASERWEHVDPANASLYNESPRVTTRASSNVSVGLDLEVDAEYDFYEDGLYQDPFPIQTHPDLEYEYESDVPPRSAEQRVTSSNRTGGSVTETLDSEIGLDEDVNFDDAFVDSAVDMPDGSSSYASIEPTLESNAVEIGGHVDSTDELEGEFEAAVVTDDGDYQEQYDLNDLMSSGNESELVDDLSMELNRTHEEFTAWSEDNPYTVERSELFDSDAEPVTGAIDHIEAVENDFVYRNLSADGPNDSFETPGEFLTAQVRKAYFDRMYYYIDLIAEQYEESVEDVEDDIDEMGGPATDAGDDVLGFTQDALNADIDRSYEQIEGSPVLDDAQYEVAGSPTYLTHENISEEEDPAVRPEGATITDVDAETEHVPLTIQSENRAPWPGIPVTPVPPSFWLFQVNTWNNTIQGEYARFEVSATIGDPSDADRLTYIREERPIDVELHDGSELKLGRNEPIDFESTTEVVVMMPGGVVSTGGIPAVADTEPNRKGQTACSPTWDHVGSDYDPKKAALDDCHYPDNH